MKLVEKDEAISIRLKQLELHFDEIQLGNVFEKSKMVIFCINKQFYDSALFKELCENCKNSKKKFCLALLEEVDIDYKKFEKEIVFKVFKNFQTDLIGYQTKQLIKKIEANLQIKIVN